MSTKDFIRQAMTISVENENNPMEEIGVIDHVAEIAEDALEISELYNKVASTADQITQLEQTAAALDKIVEASQGETILVTDDSVVKLALESIVGSNIGFESISLESVADTIKAIWEAIKRFLMQIVEHVKSLFAKIFTSFGRLRKRALKIKIKAENIKAEDFARLNSPDSVNYPKSILKKLSYKGKVDSKSVEQGLKATSRVMASSFLQVKRLAGNLAEDFATAAAMIIRKEGDTRKGLKVRILNDYESEEFSGGYSIIPSDGVGVRGLKLFVEVVRKPITGEIHQPDPATQKEIIEITACILDICDVMESKKAIIKSIETTYNDIITKTNDLLKEDTGLLRRSSELSQHMALTKLAVSNYSQALSKISSVAFDISRAGLIYCEHAVVEHKKAA